MANHYSALKRVRQTERRTEFNRRSKTRLRHQIRAMRQLITDKNSSGALALLPKTFSIIDRSATPLTSTERGRDFLHEAIQILQTARGTQGT